MYFIFSLPVLILLWLIKSNEQVGLTSHGLQLCVCHLCYISSACIRPHPLSWKSAWFPSPEIFIFPLCLHFKLAQRCLFLLSTCLVQWISFLSFPSPLSLSVCPCHTLSLPHALSFALSPLSTSCCKRANVYFKRCAMHQPPPHRHSTEEKTDTTHACWVQVSTCVSCAGKSTLPHP